ELLAELLQGPLGSPAQAESAGNDQPLAVVEPIEHPLDGLLHALQRSLILVLIGAIVGGGFEHLLVSRYKAITEIILVWDRPGEVLHDRPRGIRAEFVAA